MTKQMDSNRPSNERRIRLFRADLINEIPKKPNNRATKNKLEEIHLTELLRVYLSWKIRLIAQRPRRIKNQHILIKEPYHSEYSDGISRLLEAVERGDDLTPFLSKLAIKDGYFGVSQDTTNLPNWDEMDFLLNCYGMHHFHLGTNPTNNRSDIVLFAQITREEFNIIGLFNHTVFYKTKTSERERFLNIIDHIFSSSTNGSLSVGGLGNLGITMGGNPTMTTLMAQQHVRSLNNIEPNLDNREFVKHLFPNSENPKLSWHYNHMDLGIFEKESNTFSVVQKGIT